MVTAQDVSAAIRKDGYEQGFGHYVYNFRDKITACAIGQASLNLDVDVDEIRDALYGTHIKALCPNKADCSYSYRGLAEFLDGLVIHLNDHHKWTLEQIADWLDGVLATKGVTNE